MKIEEALNYADEWAKSQTFYEGMQGWRVVCAVLAAEVRRLRVPAVEAVPLGYALANLSDKTDCIPLYMHPPSLDDETKKLQNLLSENARLSILNHLYEQISDGREEFSAMDMDYWDSSHDNLLEAIQNKLDDDTRKMVLELCNVVDNYTDIPLTKQIREKLGAGE